MISVVIAAYNASAYIGETIDSVLKQTYPNWELIVVDDGSSDNTAAVVEGYAAQDKRVRLIRNEHGGVCKARNTGLNAAQYPWIAALDADDIAMPERLEKQLAAAQADPEVIIWGCYLYQINANHDIIGTIRSGPVSKAEFYALDRSATHIAIQGPTALFRRDIALRVGGYDEQLVAGEESELWDRMTECGPAVVIPEPLVCYRYHSQSMSATRFFDMQMLIEFPAARHRAKAAGRMLTLEEYVESYRRKPLLERVRRRIALTGRLYYRNAGVRLANKQRYRAVWLMLVALALNPEFTLTRIGHRVTKRRYG